VVIENWLVYAMQSFIEKLLEAKMVSLYFIDHMRIKNGDLKLQKNLAMFAFLIIPNLRRRLASMPNYKTKRCDLSHSRSHMQKLPLPAFEAPIIQSEADGFINELNAPDG